MKNSTKTIYIFVTVITLFLFGCALKAESFSTFSGQLQETKDGYYLNGNVILEEEISKYNPQFNFDDYKGKDVQIVGKISTSTQEDCTNEAGEITQCRQGETSYIYDIQSIK